MWVVGVSVEGSRGADQFGEVMKKGEKYRELREFFGKPVAHPLGMSAERFASLSAGDQVKVRRMQHEVRKWSKPHIRIREANLCRTCGSELEPGAPRYWGHFRNWTFCATTFHGICEAAGKYLRGTYA